MEIIIFFSILIAVLAVLTSIILVRRIKKQIAEMTDALMDVKNGKRASVSHTPPGALSRLVWAHRAFIHARAASSAGCCAHSCFSG